MKLLQPLLAVSALATGVRASQKVVPVPFSRQAERRTGLRRRAGTFSQELNNNLTGGGYYAQVTVGTPPQPVNLILDTGSSDVWVLDSRANLCNSEALQLYYGDCLATYDPSQSSTYSLVSDDSFSIQYVDGSGAEGNYIKDNLSIGGANITALQMGLAENSTINSGLLGVGFSANVAATKQYPNIIDMFMQQDLIASEAYSLYLDDLHAETGTILFGGLDTAKFIGELKAVPIQPDAETGTYSSFTVALSSFTTTADNGTVANYTRAAAIPVILDSGTTLTYLPSSIADRVFDAFGAYDDTSSGGTGLVYVDCGYLSDSKNLTFDFQFGGTDGPLIRVPIDEMILDNVDSYTGLGLQVPDDLPFDNACSFGLQANQGYYLLGDTFLRSAYVVYDLSNKTIAMAPANLNSTDTHVVEITKESGIPLLSGVASQVTAEQTATGLPGISGNSALPTVTVTSTGSPSASSTGNAAARAVPAPNWEAAAVATIAAGFGLVGAGLILL
ncbi:Uu.00g112720.m01.CDS01 [Anthostomella pinea]|uniref:Uu.00g112720.m01.CDS01 n=1 Tax=Anthostomella pinea TaxID=933095 RepID=A0AAI8VF91_9PEZI|nr:Uu.00g112720.m01.CDS01 [Anthostomella pinea]